MRKQLREIKNKKEIVIWFLLFTFLIGIILSLYIYNLRVDGSIVPIENNNDSNKSIIEEYNKTYNNTPVRKVIQVYYDDVYRPSYKNIRYDLVTDVLWSFVKVNGDGSLNYEDYGEPDEMISYAHGHGVKAILSFKETDGEANQFLSDPDARTVAIDNLLDEVKRVGFDGIDIDIETATPNSKHRRNDMTSFIQELSSTFKTSNPDYRISIAVSITNSGNIFDVNEIKNYVDYLMIMAYDICDSSSYVSGPVAPMDNPDEACYGTSVNQGIDYWKNSGMPLNKILLGVPYYGFRRETDSSERLANVNGEVTWIRLDNIPNYDHERHFDDSWKTPWQVWEDDNGQWYQLQYEDVESLSYKYELMEENNLGGIGIWAINYGLKRQDLWQLIEDKFYQSEN